MTRPRILISNDDGITAPGLKALAAAIHADGFASFAVSAPSGERSAQSHSISVSKHLHAWELPVEGAVEAFAVDGTPADSVMIALNGPLLKDPVFDLVVSGINRGDNCGLHVIYSGTVGAAREAACKDIPAVAVSLDNYLARTEEQYEAAATHTVALLKALLGVLPAPRAAPELAGRSLRSWLAGTVVNVNVPKHGLGDIAGLYLARQGDHCFWPAWQQLEADPHVAEGHEHRVTLRAFRNAAGALRSDASHGCDSWAVAQGWVSVTPVGLLSDIPLTADSASARAQPRAVQALAAALAAAAAHLGVDAGGIPDGMLAAAGGKQDAAAPVLAAGAAS